MLETGRDNVYMNRRGIRGGEAWACFCPVFNLYNEEANRPLLEWRTRYDSA
ncbi:MAG: Teichoic acid export ATP-binding protein TagH [Nitrospira sp.]|nr:MAG: Teichoic acid export ATP-binding protein TagH [Nitrospira sp.]